MASSSYGVGMTNRISAIRSRDSELIPRADTYVQPSDVELSVNEVLKIVEEITEEIEQISQRIQRVKSNHTDILTSFLNTGAKEDNEKLEEEISQLSHHITDQLKRMKQELDRDGVGPQRNSADFRIRKAQYNTLARKFRAVMQEYTEIQEEYRERNKEKIQRQLKMAGHEVTSDELDEILDKDMETQAFTASLLGDTLAQRRHMVTEVQNRHGEILRLEQNINELHNMFYDLAQLVFEQGELVNQIEYNVDHAGVYTERAARVVTKARELKKSNRRLKCIICICVTSVVAALIVAILVAIIIVVFTFFDPLNSNSSTTPTDTSPQTDGSGMYTL